MAEHQDQYDLSWLYRFALLFSKEDLALTEKERQSIREEKQVFLEEIGIKEEMFHYIIKNISFLFERYNLASTNEEKESILDKMYSLSGEVNNFKKEVDKKNLEKKKKSAAPAA